MKVGTRSILFGAHCWFIHPWFVALAWWKLYGFPWDFRLWVAFFVHDLGYWGKPNMDGPEGEDHVWLGANIMERLFDPKYATWRTPQTWIGRLCDRLWGHEPYGESWFNLCFYHSRFMAKRYDHLYSKLCVADKFSVCLEPWWLYIPRGLLSGEIEEYRRMADLKEGSKYHSTQGGGKTVREWHRRMTGYLRKWVNEHRDGREDSWTGRNHG